LPPRPRRAQYDFSTIAQLDGPLTANFFPPHARPEVKALAFWMTYAAGEGGPMCACARARVNIV
jgi:hypothetical protein